MDRISLNGEWLCSGKSPEGEEKNLKGTVPGCVHTDLVAAGELEDLFWRNNGDYCQWIEKWAWRYERNFTVNKVSDDVFLEFRGLDVYCEIYLNGALLGKAANMFLTHRFPAGKLLRKGENHISVQFYPPLSPVFAKPPKNAAFTWERLYTRRIQCTYSWDWVHRFVTCGICGDVSVCYPSPCEIETVHIETKCLDSHGAQILLEYHFSIDTEDAFAETVITDPSGKIVFQGRQLIVEPEMVKYIDMKDPVLWWPNGYGSPSLYTFSLRVVKEGFVLSEKTEKFGIRTVRILQERDLPGTPCYEMCVALKKEKHISDDFAFLDRNKEFSGFILLVNDTPIMCKGANWVPCEPFVSAEKNEKITEILRIAAEGYGNMIRVWGGGVFEKDHFYNECDRLGLMVTQDFLMACGDYPEEEEWFLEELRKEAEEAALRLRNHPCLVWWTGDNENATLGSENEKVYPGRKAALLAIGPVLRRLDPNRYFLPSSPYGGTPYASATSGTTHYTYLSDEMFTFIRETDMRNFTRRFNAFLSRFCAEGPSMGAPAITSLRKFMSEEDIFGNAEDMWRYHTKNNPCPEFQNYELFDHLRMAASKMYGDFTCGVDKVCKMQYFQYDWVRHSMELYRRKKWFSSGMIYWMLNDCWPASGWSIIDYYNIPKAGFFGFKKASAPVISSVEKRKDTGGSAFYDLYVCSDTLVPVKGRVWFFVLNLETGETLHTWDKEFELGGNISECVLSIPALDVDSLCNNNCIPIWEMECTGGYDRGFLCEPRPRDICFPDAEIRVLTQEQDFISVTAEKFVPAVILDGDCVFEDNYFSLMPGEMRNIRFRIPEGSNGVGKISVYRLGGTY